MQRRKKRKKNSRNSDMNSLPTFRQFEVIHVNNFHLFLTRIRFQIKTKDFSKPKRVVGIRLPSEYNILWGGFVH